MKKTLMTDGVDGFQCKICKACFTSLPALIDHYTSRHFNIETHIAMQKRVINISTQSTSKELGTALEILKKHGKRLTPTWNFEAFRAEVMRSRGKHYGTHGAQSSTNVDTGECRKSQCTTRSGDDQWGNPYSLSDRRASGEIPTKGRSKLYRTESRRLEHHSVPASSTESVSK
eukprot:5828185-Amphidinium_carterae.1